MMVPSVMWVLVAWFAIFVDIGRYLYLYGNVICFEISLKVIEFEKFYLMKFIFDAKHRAKDAKGPETDFTLAKREKNSRKKLLNTPFSPQISNLRPWVPHAIYTVSQF